MAKFKVRLHETGVHDKRLYRYVMADEWYVAAGGAAVFLMNNQPVHAFSDWYQIRRVDDAS